MNNLVLFMRGPDDGQLRLKLREGAGIRGVEHGGGQRQRGSLHPAQYAGGADLPQSTKLAIMSSPEASRA